MNDISMLTNLKEYVGELSDASTLSAEKLIETFLKTSEQQAKAHGKEMEKISNKIEANTDCVREMLTELTKNSIRVDNIAEGVKNICTDQNDYKSRLHSQDTRLVKLETIVDAASQRNDELRSADKELRNTSKDDSRHSIKTLFAIAGWVVGLIGLVYSITRGT